MPTAELKEVISYAEKNVKELSYGNKLHVPTHLSIALETSLKQGAYKKTVQILCNIIQHQQCSRQFALQIISTIFVKTSYHRSLEFSELAGIFSKITSKRKRSLACYEAPVIVLFNLIRNEQYEQAYDEILRHEDILSTANCDSITRSVLAAILLIYKFILQMFVANFEQEGRSDISKTIESLSFQSYLLPLLAEPYIVTLARGDSKARFNDQAKVEKFIYRYMESESNMGWGVGSHEHTLAILNAHSYRVSESVKFNILEEISQRDPGNPKVLELCKMHLIMDQRQKQRQTKCESDIGTESELSDNDDSYSYSENLNRCLELVFNFLDTQMRKQVNSSTSEAWSLLADVLRRICIKGTYGCIKKLINLWHFDRKDWWTYFRNVNFKEDAMNETVRNKALVCYLLDSDAHPFVIKSLSLENSSHLGSLIKQFKPSKRKMDETIKAILGGKQFSPILLVSTPPKDALQSETRLRSFLSKYQHLDSQKMAQSFSRYLSRHPFAGKSGDYQREATARQSTQILYQLPISERLTKRYEQRRCSTPRSRQSSDGSEHSSSSDFSKSPSDTLSETYDSPGRATSVTSELAMKKSGEKEDLKLLEPAFGEVNAFKTETRDIEYVIKPSGTINAVHPESEFLENLSQQSSDSEPFVPCDEDVGCHTEVTWSTRLRSWCLNKVPICREIPDLTCQFLESYEKFKAKQSLNRPNEPVEFSRWRRFLDNATWQSLSDNDSSCSEGSKEEYPEDSSNTTPSAAGNSQSLDCYPAERSEALVEQYDIGRQSLNNSSVYSACGNTSITDYPNKIDRVLRRLSCNDVLPLSGKIEETEYVVEADVNELHSILRGALHQRDSFSPDMFTDYESAIESLKSSPTTKSVSSKDIYGPVVMSSNAIEKHIETAESNETSKISKEAEAPSFPEDEHSIARGTKRTRKLIHEAVKTARRSSREKMISREAKGTDKIPKRKNLQKSWSVNDSSSSVFTALLEQKNTMKTIRQRKLVRRKISSRKSKRDFLSSVEGSLKKRVAPDGKMTIDDSNPEKKSSCANLHDWSASLVDQILRERRKST